jgi:hypothetical protein
MIRNKTLSLPLISALCVSALAPASAQVTMIIGSEKTFRQDKKGVQFRGGSFEVDLSDGDGIFQQGCVSPTYFGTSDACPLGATAFLIEGLIGEELAERGPYFSVETVIPALIVEPRRPDLVFLRAAPASKLPRPAAGFNDTSFALYYNLQSTSVSEYVVSRYSIERTYTSKDRAKMDSEVVPGAYYYNFPRLNNPNLVSPITSVLYPITEGYGKVNKQKVGFRYTSVNGNKWTKDGFVKLSSAKPNIVKWEGFSPTTVYPGVDKLYLSIRVLSDPSNPLSDTDLTDAQGMPQSIFPNFTTGGNPRVALANPFVKSYTTPPIFPSGTRGVLELELDRTLQSGGVSYDFSSRKFQIPIVVVDQYEDYKTVTFDKKKKKRGILDDYDGDGFNNLTEWILGSNAAESTSTPVPPVAQAHAVVNDPDTGLEIDPAYFGFTFFEKVDTDPAVSYTIQRSKDGGATWLEVESDADWIIDRVEIPAGFARETDPAQVRVRLQSLSGAAPAGSAGDTYRLKIAQVK